MAVIVTEAQTFQLKLSVFLIDFPLKSGMICKIVLSDSGVLKQSDKERGSSYHHINVLQLLLYI